jgi:hypothetical protein
MQGAPDTSSRMSACSIRRSCGGRRGTSRTAPPGQAVGTEASLAANNRVQGFVWVLVKRGRIITDVELEEMRVEVVVACLYLLFRYSRRMTEYSRGFASCRLKAQRDVT